MNVDEHDTFIDRGTTVRNFLGVLDEYMEDPEITEIAVNYPGYVFFEKHSKWHQKECKDVTLNWATHLASSTGVFSNNNITDANPLLSGILPDGERVQIVFPPACTQDTVAICIRKPNRKIFTLDDYEESGFFSKVKPLKNDLSEVDKKLLQYLHDKDYRKLFHLAVYSGKTIVVSGGTGSGKTTFMKTLCQSIPTHSRVITIEDTFELNLPHHPNRVHLFYPANAVEGVNVVTATSLLKTCLRMKPDRILPTELRSGETFDFIDIASSGHGGSITSCHADNVEQTFDRLMTMTYQNPRARVLSEGTVNAMLRKTVDMVINIHNDVETGVGRHINQVWFDPEAKIRN